MTARDWDAETASALDDTRPEPEPGSMIAAGGWCAPASELYDFDLTDMSVITEAEDEDEDDMAVWDAEDKAEEIPVQEPGPEPAHLIVVGSFHWDNEGAIFHALSTWAQANPPETPVILYTSGCPHGAEAIARSFGSALGWHNVQLRDEELVLVPGIAFAFVKDASPGVTSLVAALQRRVWVRVLTDDTTRQTSLWADR